MPGLSSPSSAGQGTGASNLLRASPEGWVRKAATRAMNSQTTMLRSEAGLVPITSSPEMRRLRYLDRIFTMISVSGMLLVDAYNLYHSPAIFHPLILHPLV